MMDTGIKRIVGPTILLHSGEYFDFESPETSNITIGDIAHALSNICRFTGHARRFYSVAEHSVHASYLVPPEDAFAALMHDAAEAVLGDVSKPLKRLLPDYRRIEQRVERAIFAQFGLPDELPASVTVADQQMLFIEQRACMRNADDWGENTLYTRMEPMICFLAPPGACNAFLTRYSELRQRTDFPPETCTAWEDCKHDGICHDPAFCGAIGPYHDAFYGRDE